MFSDWSLLMDVKLIDFHVFVQCSLAKLSSSCSFCFDFYLFFKIYLFMAVLGLHCCMPAFSSCSEQGCSLRCTGISLWWFLLSRSTGPRLTGFSCSAACEIFTEQDPLHWQATSYPLYHQGSPCNCFMSAWEEYVCSNFGMKTLNPLDWRRSNLNYNYSRKDILYHHSVYRSKVSTK